MSDYKINQTVKIKPYEDEPELLGVIKRISKKSEYVVWGEDDTTYYLTEEDIVGWNVYFINMKGWLYENNCHRYKESRA